MERELKTGTGCPESGGVPIPSAVPGAAGMQCTGRGWVRGWALFWEGFSITADPGCPHSPPSTSWTHGWPGCWGCTPRPGPASCRPCGSTSNTTNCRTAMRRSSSTATATSARYLHIPTSFSWEKPLPTLHSPSRLWLCPFPGLWLVPPAWGCPTWLHR